MNLPGTANPYTTLPLLLSSALSALYEALAAQLRTRAPTLIASLRLEHVFAQRCVSAFTARIPVRFNWTLITMVIKVRRNHLQAILRLLDNHGYQNRHRQLLRGIRILQVFDLRVV